jgi:hypothetical protein
MDQRFCAFTLLSASLGWATSYVNNGQGFGAHLIPFASISLVYEGIAARTLVMPPK